MPKVVLPPVQLHGRLKYQGTVSGRPWVNLFYFRYSSLAGIDLHALATSFSGIWNAQWAGQFPATSALTQTSVWDLSSQSGIVGIDSTTHAGTHNPPSTTGLGVNSAACVSWQIAYRWRGGHFRSYIPVGYGVDISGGVNLDPTFRTNLGLVANGFMGAINALTLNGQTFHMATVRYFGNGQSSSNPPVPLQNPIVNDVAQAVVHSRLDSMRRRLGKEQY